MHPHPPQLFCQSAASKLLGITPFGTFPHHVYKALHSTRGITCLYTWLDCSAWSVQMVKTVHLQCDSSYIYFLIMLYHVLSKFYLHFWIDSFCLENQRIDLIQSKSTTARSWISSAGETAMSSNPWESHHMIVMKRKTPKKCTLPKLQEFTLLYCPYSLNVPDLTCHKMQTSIEICLKQSARQGSSEVRAKQCMNLQHGLHFWLATFWDQRTCAFVPPFSLKRKDSNIKIGWTNKSSHLFCRSWWCQPFCTLAVVGNHSSVKVEILLWSWHHHIPTAARLQSVGRGHPYVLMKLQEIGELSFIYMNLLMGSDGLFVKPISCLGPASLLLLAQAIWLCRSCH